jgi:hypothetical protein
MFIIKGPKSTCCQLDMAAMRYTLLTVNPYFLLITSSTVVLYCQALQVQPSHKLSTPDHISSSSKRVSLFALAAEGPACAYAPPRAKRKRLDTFPTEYNKTTRSSEVHRTCWIVTADSKLNAYRMPCTEPEYLLNPTQRAVNAIRHTMPGVTPGLSHSDTLRYVMLRYMLHPTRSGNPIRSQREAHWRKGTQRTHQNQQSDQHTSLPPAHMSRNPNITGLTARLSTSLAGRYSRW